MYLFEDPRINFSGEWLPLVHQFRRQEKLNVYTLRIYLGIQLNSLISGKIHSMVICQEIPEIESSHKLAVNALINIKITNKFSKLRQKSCNLLAAYDLNNRVR